MVPIPTLPVVRNNTVPSPSISIKVYPVLLLTLNIEPEATLSATCSKESPVVDATESLAVGKVLIPRLPAPGLNTTPKAAVLIPRVLDVTPVT